MRLHELIEKRANAVTAMRALADLADKENRDLSADEERRFGDLKTEVTGLDRQIERARELEQFERSAPGVVTRRGDGRYEDRAREFSLCRAIASQLPEANVDAGLEREISQEVSRRSGRKFQGIAVPDEVFLTERRTLTVETGSPPSADALMPNVHRGDLFVDRLRSALVTGRLGATILDGLIGTIDIPKQTASSTAQWVGEEGDLTETDAAFDDVNLTPKTIGAMTSFSRRTLINAVPSVEQIVRADLSAVIANAIDLQAMTGNGSGNTPVGIVNAGAATVDLSGGVTWEKVLEFIATVQHADAAGAAMGWALNAWAIKRLRATPRDDTASLDFIMESPTALAGFAAAMTSALPGDPNPSPAEAATVIFGNWSDLLIGYWSGVDVLVNPYESTAYAKGRVLVRAMRDCDVAVRHAEAFAYSANMPVEPSA